MKHTPWKCTSAGIRQPWATIRDARGKIVDSSKPDVAIVVVKCVNACAGINPASIPVLLEAARKVVETFYLPGQAAICADYVKMLRDAIALAEKGV